MSEYCRLKIRRLASHDMEDGGMRNLLKKVKLRLLGSRSKRLKRMELEKQEVKTNRCVKRERKLENKKVRKRENKKMRTR